jgi:hypothetical protein
MATYKGIQGYSVQKLSSDPTASEAEGQLWYNSTTGKFKIAISAGGAWASGGEMNISKKYRGTCGTKSAAIAMGGSPYTGATEIYDGTTWTTSPASLNTPRTALGASGTSTACVVAGGYGVNASSPIDYNAAQTETWNGTAWTAVNPLNTARQASGCIGKVSTAAVIAGGVISTKTDISETWNGSTWTETNALVSAHAEMASIGTSTAGLLAGGYAPTWLKTVESYDGTCWTEGNDLLTARAQPGGGGSSTSALVYGGTTAPTTYIALTESYDGSSWTETADLATAREAWQSTGTDSTSSLAITGRTAPTTITNVTEEWTDPSYTIKTVTVS